MGEKTITVNIFQRKMVIIWMFVIFYFIHQSFVAMETGVAFKLQSVSRNNGIMKGFPFPYSSKRRTLHFVLL